MIKDTSEANEVRQAPERRVAHVIHYDLSYVVQGTEYGTDGAIVLLHDIMGGAFTWADVMPQLAVTNRAVYAIDMLGYGQSEHPWPADTSNWGHADNLSTLFEQLNLTNFGYAFEPGTRGRSRAHRHQLIPAQLRRELAAHRNGETPGL